MLEYDNAHAYTGTPFKYRGELWRWYGSKFMLVAALFFYRQRLRSLIQSAVFEGDIAFDPHIL
jgi:hypothetical protein